MVVLYGKKILVIDGCDLHMDTCTYAVSDLTDKWTLLQNRCASCPRYMLPQYFCHESCINKTYDNGDIVSLKYYRLIIYLMETFFKRDPLSFSRYFWVWLSFMEKKFWSLMAVTYIWTRVRMQSVTLQKVDCFLNCAKHP
jgi:hypothetical protein